MDKKFSKSNIIPVTFMIRKYLKDTSITDDDKKRFSKLVDDTKYCLQKEENGFIIYDKNDQDFYLDNIKKTEEKVKFYKDIAKKLNKSYIWVYQEVVLDGYGNYVDVNSDIYKASLLAYKDVYGLDTDTDFISEFENAFILAGHFYDEDFESNKKILSRR